MKKLLCCIVLLLFLSVLQAEDRPGQTTGIKSGQKSESESEQKSESGKKLFFTQFKFGLGVDFEGMQGRPPLEDLNSAAMRNQLGATVGLDFGWSLFRKTAGKGAGDFCLGFGFDFQYWAPTTYMSRDNYDQRDRWWKGKYDELDYMYLHYMRVPVTLNAAYEFKVNAGTLRRTGLWFSLGANNNFFFLNYHSDDEKTIDLVKGSFDEKSHWKISGTWLLGLNMVFESNWIFKVSIGGDFGQKMIRSHIFFSENTLYYREYDRGRFGRLFYGHHEFLMFETGYRFGFGE